MNYKKIIVWSGALNFLLLIFAVIFYLGQYLPFLNSAMEGSENAFYKQYTSLPTKTPEASITSSKKIDIKTGLLFLGGILSIFPLLILSLLLGKKVRGLKKPFMMTYDGNNRAKDLSLHNE